MIFCLSNFIKLTKNINRTLWSDTIQLDEFKVLFYTFLSPANEVCEGYVFNRCVSIHRGGLGLCPGRGFPSRGSQSRGVSIQGVSVQGVSVWGVSVQGISVQGGSVQRSLSRGVSVHDGLCPGGLCPGGLCPGGLCPGGFCPGGLSVQRGLCLAGSLFGGVLETPPYGNEWAVRILLECILVNFLSIFIVHLSTWAMTNTTSSGIQERTYWTNTNTTSNFNHTEENQTDILIGSDGNQSNSVFAIIAQVGMYSDLVITPMGVFVNFLSIAIFVKSRMAWTSVGLHLMYLAVADNLVLVSGFIGSSKFWHVFINIPDLWSSNIITCSGTYLSLNAGFTWSGALLASATVERFLAIAVPLKVKCWNIYHKSKILMGIYFILSLMLCSYGVQCYELTSIDGTNVCTPSSKYQDMCYIGDMIVVGVIANVPCFTVILVFTALTTISLHKYKQKRADLGTLKDTGREIRMTLMLVTVAILFVVLRAGDIIIYFLSESSKLSQTIIDTCRGIFPVFIVLSNINHSINFIVYVIFLEAFRKTFVGMFSCCRRSIAKD